MYGQSHERSFSHGQPSFDEAVPVEALEREAFDRLLTKARSYDQLRREMRAEVGRFGWLSEKVGHTTGTDGPFRRMGEEALETFRQGLDEFLPAIAEECVRDPILWGRIKAAGGIFPWVKRLGYHFQDATPELALFRALEAHLQRFQDRP